MTWKEDGTLLDAYAGLYNTQTGTGTSRDKSLNFQINSEALTISREECEMLFKTSGLVQKIVALLPEDSPIEWYSINLGSEKTAPQDISNYLEDQLNLHEKLVEASVLARLHGNAYIVIFANDGRSSDQPIVEDDLEEITDLKVLSSYEMRPSVYGSMTRGTTVGSLIEPEYYDLIGVTELNKRLPESEQIPLSQWRIHRSRVLRFGGRKLYNWMLYKNQGYDLSVLQSVVIAFSSYMQGVLASSGMIQDYSVFTYKLKGLAELILKGQSDAIIKRFLAIQMGMSYNKGLAMDADTEEAGYVQRQYGGVGDICDRLKALLTAESGIPHTKLWGEGSHGNTSGQSEKSDYADALESFQRHNWLKPTRELIRLALLSKSGVTKGKIPKGWKITTRSSLRLDLEEEASLRQKQARTDQVYRLMGVLHPLEIRKNRFGSPDYSMDTILDPDIDKLLWEHKDDAQFTLPVLSSKMTAWSSEQQQAQGTGIDGKVGGAHIGTDIGTKMEQAAIAGTGSDGGNNAQMQAEESDRDRMSENRRLDSPVKRKFKWKDSTLAIEHLPGDIRHDRLMKGVYGYIQKHTGHDNEPLDFYGTPEFYKALDNGEQPDSKIFEIYQLQGDADNPVDRKSFDETKIVLGAADKSEAMQTYLNHMPEHFLGGINELSPGELRQYRYRRDSYREDIFGFNRNEPRDANGRWTAGGGHAASGKNESVTGKSDHEITRIETDISKLASASQEWDSWHEAIADKRNEKRLQASSDALNEGIKKAKAENLPYVILPYGSGLAGKEAIENSKRNKNINVEVETDANENKTYSLPHNKNLIKINSDHRVDYKGVQPGKVQDYYSAEDADASARKALKVYAEKYMIEASAASSAKKSIDSRITEVNKLFKDNGLDKVDFQSVEDNLWIGSEIRTALKDHDGSTKIMGVVDKTGKVQSLVSYSKEKDHLHVDFLATAPWNLSSTSSTKSKGAAAKALAAVANESQKTKTRNGKIKLSALEKAQPFYEHIGFKEDKNGDMVLSPAKSESLIKKYS